MRGRLLSRALSRSQLIQVVRLYVNKYSFQLSNIYSLAFLSNVFQDFIHFFFTRKTLIDVAQHVFICVIYHIIKR